MAAITITDARKAFTRWVEAVGGMTTSEAREKGLPTVGTFHLEEFRMGDGKVTVRISQIFNENGATSDPLGYMRLSCREFVGAMSAAISTLEVVRKIAAQKRILTPVEGYGSYFTDQFGLHWATFSGGRDNICSECGTTVTSGYCAGRHEQGQNPWRDHGKVICEAHATRADLVTSGR